MLVREAKWYARRIEELGDDALFPMLNVGSHTEEFRTREQPWIDRYIFAPPRRRGMKIVHLDLQNLPSVDLVGDLTEPGFLAKLRSMRFRSVFCSNLLEHVPNPEEIAEAAVEAVEPGGYLLASCPNRFPYHLDPIDTMFRPSPEELPAIFPHTEVIRADRLGCGTLATYMLGKLISDAFALVRNLFRRRAQLVRTTSHGLSATQTAPWLWRTFYEACIVLRKKG